MKIIYITKGHLPGTDPGAVYKQQREIDKIAGFVDAFKAIKMGGKDVFEQSELTIVCVPWLGNNDKVKFINDDIKRRKLSPKDCIAIDIHFDVASDDFIAKRPTYMGVYYGGKESKAYADRLLSLFNLTAQSVGGRHSWGRHHSEARQGRIGFVAFTSCPALLVEAGYVAGQAEKASHALVSFINFLKEFEYGNAV